jgi:HD-like signal output (HDOD) protein
MTNNSTAACYDLNRLIDGGQLPALPQSAIKILELSKNPNIGPNEFAVPIESDPGLASQVLKFVNSSYFGFSREIPSVKHAITLVGIRTIKNFTLWSAVFSLMPNPKCGAFDLKKLWQDSLRRALFSRALGKSVGVKDVEEAFAAGLLQDMALPLLVKEFPTEYSDLLTARNDGHHRLSDLEQEKFGWTHAEVAASMARKWRLPEELIAPIELHPQMESLDFSASPLAGVVALSSLLPAAIDASWVEWPQFEQLYARIPAKQAPQPLELLAQIDLEFVEFAPVLNMSAAAKSLVESHQEAAAAVTP